MSLGQWGLHTRDRSFYDAAIGSYSRALMAWPAFAAAYFRRGIILSRELGEHSRGLDDLDRALACAPEWAELYLQRGLIRRFYGDPHAAAADLRRFLDLAPASSWRGEAERQLHQLEMGEG